jgi:hypothetical protein
VKSGEKNGSSAWCIGTHYVHDDPKTAAARTKGTVSAERTIRDEIGRAWRRTHTIDKEISWSASEAIRLKLGDNFFDVVEKNQIKPPASLVHKELVEGGKHAVLFLCREKGLRSRQLKKLKPRLDRKTYLLLRRAILRRLNMVQLGQLNEIFE